VTAAPQLLALEDEDRPDRVIVRALIAEMIVDTRSSPRIAGRTAPDAAEERSSE